MGIFWFYRALRKGDDDVATYIMSDLHGWHSQWQQLMTRVNFSTADRLFILGDVIDRGGSGLDILQQLMDMPNATLLLGNHEYMLLAVCDHGRFSALDGANYERVWLNNGGQVTRKHWQQLPAGKRADILDYLYACPLCIEKLAADGQSYYLVHGYPDRWLQSKNATIGEMVASKASHGWIWSMLWDRVDGTEGFFDDRIVLFGHTPTSFYQSQLPCSIWQGQGAIGVDCGAATIHPGGLLACLRLEDGAVFYS